MEKYISLCEQQTEHLACGFAKTLKPGDIIAFKGGLGAGKTAFVRGLALGLGIASGVSSPTFSLVHEYEGASIKLYHFDMYRIRGYDSLESTGFFDYLESSGIIAVEWSENIAEFLPEGTIYISITATGENSREIIIEKA